jgi:hypothetical protein
MIRKLLAVIAALLGVLLTLASVLLLLWMTFRIELMENPLLRTLAILGALVGGVGLLVGSVFISTRIAVLLFARKSSETELSGREARGS